VAGHWFSLVSSTNKANCHDITEILLKVALNTITLTHYHTIHFIVAMFVLILLMDTTSGAGTAYPSGVSEFTPVF
jgi:hypothetical protein